MRITAVESTERFVGSADDCRQVVEVTVTDAAAGGVVRVGCAGVSGRAEMPPGANKGPRRLEVALDGLASQRVGATVVVEVDAGDAATATTAEVVVAEPGWTMWMIPHFHYDPVWWNTQAAYTTTWNDLPGTAQQHRSEFQQTGFDLVRLHLQTARRDPDYKFVLAEVDYLKPYWDAHPGDRDYLRRLLADGRLELMGGTYNEPNTNLTTAETTVRNFVYGVGFQRDIFGADPRTAWQLDVFGHDPQFPGLAAEAGLTGSSWARGPFHQWGPMLGGSFSPDNWGDPSTMQFRSEFEWRSPSGKGVLTHYMPAHYSAGWWLDAAPSLEAAEVALYQLFVLLKKVGSTRNVLLPVGTDYTPPNRWVTEAQRHWNARYAWPRFRCALPREFFAAVRAELDERGVTPSVQTRDMNPIYTGKDVSFVDTKQAQRSAESLLVDAEKFATITAFRGARYPHATLDKAWRQLVYGAHHDAITGSESDQVYLDLLTGWREAHDLATGVLAASLGQLAGAVAVPDGPSGAVTLTVFNPSSWTRRDLVRARVTFGDRAGTGVRVLDPDGADVPVLVEHAERDAAGHLRAADVVFLATDVPSVGYRSGWQVVIATGEPHHQGWEPIEGTSIESEALRLRVDPERGGCVDELVDKRHGRQVLQPGQVGNELIVDKEYPAHPSFGEGPWHLLPTGERDGSARRAATSVQASRCALGQRLTVTGTIGAATYRQELTLWDGIDHLDAATTIDGFEGADHLVRLRWPAEVPGGLPVSEVGDAVVGRGFALIEVDVAEDPWTLDNPAVNWFALSSTARVRLVDPEGQPGGQRALGVGELIGPDGDDSGAPSATLATALVAQGVTSTASRGDGPRYGQLAVDSNLPDFRVALGHPDANSFTAGLLAAVDPAYGQELHRQLAQRGAARLWVPAREPLARAWRPSADLTGFDAVAVLVVVGDDEVAAVAADLDDAVIEVTQPAALGALDGPSLDDYTVAVVNRGVPSFAVDPTGALHLSILRSCTGWPSGTWIDPPRRSTPDGSNFEQEHWSHTFEYAIKAAAGDWRVAGLVPAGHDFNHPLHVVAGAGGDGSADLPARHSFVGLEPAGDVVLQALKPSGNPLASGRRAPDGVGAVTARVYEAGGRARDAELRVDWPLTGARRLDVIEQPVEGGALGVEASTVRLALGPAEIATVGLEGSAGAAGAGRGVLGPDREPHQPVYTRYWLNNTGPAPLGNLPVAVHLDPVTVTIPAVDGPVAIQLTVASNRTDEAVGVDVTVGLPDGWTLASPAPRESLPPGGHLEHALEVVPPAGTADGIYWVTATAVVDGQAVADVCRVLVGETPEADFSARLLTGEVSVAPGGSGELAVEITSAAATPVWLQAQLISPWHTWELTTEWNTGVTLEPGETRQLRFGLTAPAGASPGRWWALVKLACAGVLHYSEVAAVEVTSAAGAQGR